MGKTEGKKKPTKKVIYEIKGENSPLDIKYSLSIDPGFRYAGLVLHDKIKEDLSFYRYENKIEVNLMKSKLPEFVMGGVDVVKDYDRLIPKEVDRKHTELIMEYLHNGSTNFTEGLSSLLTTLSHIFIRELGYNRVLFVPTGSCSYLYGMRSIKDTFKRNEILEMFPDKLYGGRKKEKGKLLATAHMADAMFILTYVYFDKFKGFYKQELRESLYDIKSLN